MDASLMRFGAFFYLEALAAEDILWKKLQSSVKLPLATLAPVCPAES